MNTFYKNNKILNSIVILYAINMVNFLIWLQVSVKMFFHNKTMFFYITSLRSKRMFRFPDIYISMISYGFSSLPISTSMTPELVAANKTYLFKFFVFIIMYICNSINCFFRQILITTTFAFHKYIIFHLEYTVTLTANFVNRRIII